MSMSSRPTKAKALLEIAMRDLNKLEVKVGWFASAKYGDGTPVAYVAAIQENGAASRSIPPRPFFKPTQEQQKTEWAALMEQGVKAITKGNETAYTTLDKLGLLAAGDVRKTISQIQTPPLSLITLLARKYRKQNKGKPGYVPVAGKKIGEFAKQSKKPEDVDVTGVNPKPLVDTRVMINTLTSIVEEK